MLSKSGIADKTGNPKISFISRLYLIFVSKISLAKANTKESIKPAAKAMRTFFVTFGDDGDFGNVASSTTFKLALSLKDSKTSGAVCATASAMVFASNGFLSTTTASKTSVS